MRIATCDGDRACRRRPQAMGTSSYRPPPHELGPSLVASVLVIDDDPRFVRLVQSFLDVRSAQPAYTLVSAHNGRERPDMAQGWDSYATMPCSHRKIVVY